MDDPALPARSHDAALRGLARLNAVSLAHRTLWARLHAISRRADRTLHVLDVASGSADLPVRLDALARRHGVRLRWTLSDRSPHALDRASERARAAGMQFDAIVVDALEGALPDADVVVNSLFLHHFDADDVIRILRAMRKAARLAVGVSDLRRTRTGLAVVAAASRVVTRSPVVHHDGAASVRAAHEPEEMRVLAARAGLEGAVVENADPVRWRLWWNKPDMEAA
jgi:predicted nicotinamide N-methyase